MRTIIAGGLIACLPALATAVAADLSSRRETFAPPPPIPAFSWAGFYAGVQVGYAFGTDRTTLNQGPTTRAVGGMAGTAPLVGGTAGMAGAVGGTAGTTAGTGTTANGTAALVATPAAVATLGTPGTPATTETVFPPPLLDSFGADGVIGGGHVGYNFVTRPLGGFGGAIGVFGFEGDVDGSSYRKPVTGIIFGNGFMAFPFSGSVAGVDVGVQGSVRGRAGVAFDRLLLYATGGVAFADISSSVDFINDATFQHTRVGYTVGGGVEYALLNNVALRVEYRYSDFGSFTDPLAAAATPSATVRHHETLQRVQAGVSYLFATPVAPVVARY